MALFKNYHLPQHLEIVFMLLIGIFLQVMDGSPFTIKERWKAVWETDLPENYFGPFVQKCIKAVLSMIVTVRCTTTYAYVVSAMLVIFCILKKTAPKLMLLWLLVALVKSISMIFLEGLTGVYVCSAFGKIRKACVEFFFVKALELIFSTYLWGSVLNIYKDIDKKLKEMDLDQKQLGLSAQFRRPRARSMIDESTLNKTTCLNNFERRDVPMIILQMLRRSEEMSQDSLLDPGMMLTSVSNLGSFDNIKTSQSLGELGFTDLSTAQIFGLEEDSNLSKQELAKKFLKLTNSEVRRIQMNKCYLEKDIYNVDDDTWKRVVTSRTHISQPKEPRTEVFIRKISPLDLSEEKISITESRKQISLRSLFSLLQNDKEDALQKAEEEQDEDYYDSEGEDDSEHVDRIFMSNLKEGGPTARVRVNALLKKTKGVQYSHLYKQEYMSKIGPEVFDKASRLLKLTSLTNVFNRGITKVNSKKSSLALGRKKSRRIKYMDEQYPEKVNVSEEKSSEVPEVSSTGESNNHQPVLDDAQDLEKLQGFSGEAISSDPLKEEIAEPLGTNLKGEGREAPEDNEQTDELKSPDKETSELEEQKKKRERREALEDNEQTDELKSPGKETSELKVKKKKKRERREAPEDNEQTDDLKSPGKETSELKVKKKKKRERREAPEDNEQTDELKSPGKETSELKVKKKKKRERREAPEDNEQTDELKSPDKETSEIKEQKKKKKELKLEFEDTLNFEQPVPEGQETENIHLKIPEDIPEDISEKVEGTNTKVDTTEPSHSLADNSNKTKARPIYKSKKIKIRWVGERKSKSSFHNQPPNDQGPTDNFGNSTDEPQKPMGDSEKENSDGAQESKKHPNSKNNGSRTGRKIEVKSVRGADYKQIYYVTQFYKKQLFDILITYYDLKKGYLKNNVSLQREIFDLPEFLEEKKHFKETERLLNILGIDSKPDKKWKSEVLNRSEITTQIYPAGFGNILHSFKKKAAIKKFLKYECHYLIQKYKSLNKRKMKDVTFLSPDEESNKIDTPSKKMNESKAENEAHLNFTDLTEPAPVQREGGHHHEGTPTEIHNCHSSSSTADDDYRRSSIDPAKGDEKLETESATSDVLVSEPEDFLRNQESDEPISLYYSKAANLASPLFDMKGFIYPDHIHYSYKHVKKRGFDVDINGGFPLLMRESLTVGHPVKLEQKWAEKNSDCEITRRPMDLSFANTNAFADWQTKDQNQNVSHATIDRVKEDPADGEVKFSSDVMTDSKEDIKGKDSREYPDSPGREQLFKNDQIKTSKSKPQGQNLKELKYLYQDRDLVLIEKLLKMHKKLNRGEDTGVRVVQRLPVQINSPQLHSNKGRLSCAINPAKFLQESKSSSEKKKSETQKECTKDMFARLDREALLQSKIIHQSLGPNRKI